MGTDKTTENLSSSSEFISAHQCYPWLTILNQIRFNVRKSQDGSAWNLGFPKTKHERVKLAKLANFKPVKMPEKRELGQLCQLGQHSFSKLQIERNRVLNEIERVEGEGWKIQDESED